MKRLLPFFIILLSGLISVNAQPLSVSNFLNAISLSVSKGEHYISQKGFHLFARQQEKDTMSETYFFRGKRKRNLDTIDRKMERTVCKGGLSLSYYTSSEEEFRAFRAQLHKEGFRTHSKPDSSKTLNEVYQYRDLTAWLIELPGEDFKYHCRIEKKFLPLPRDIVFAEDLLAFDSHEQLEYVFGPGQVKSDLYYFSQNEFSRCSVLFPHTDRQAVFIWQDEINDRQLYYLVFGGQLMLESSKHDDRPIAENAWTLKSKVRAGMHLKELRMLNGTDFSFHSVNTKYSGMVLPSSSGRIDFEKEGIVLACMNCNDMDEKNKPVLTADEALADGKRFFVFTIMLYPASITAR
jgi:hypothetical protein